MKTVFKNGELWYDISLLNLADEGAEWNLDMTCK